MGIETHGFSELENDILAMAEAMDSDVGTNRALLAGASPLAEQMRTNASSDPQVVTGTLRDSIKIGTARRKRITVGVHYKDMGAYYANPVEFGHGGPAPAPAHPFVRPAFDVRSGDAYEEIKRVLRDELTKK
jgi:HK97 gp10 family phage protein